MEWYLRFNSPKESMHTDKEQGEMQSRTWPPQGQAVGGCGTEISWHHTALKALALCTINWQQSTTEPYFISERQKDSFDPRSITFSEEVGVFIGFALFFFFVIDFLIYLFFAKKVST